MFNLLNSSYLSLVYSLTKMKLETIIKSENMDERLITKHYHNVYSVGRIHFCFIQGNSVR